MFHYLYYPNASNSFCSIACFEQYDYELVSGATASKATISSSYPNLLNPSHRLLLIPLWYDDPLCLILLESATTIVATRYQSPSSSSSSSWWCTTTRNSVSGIKFLFQSSALSSPPLFAVAASLQNQLIYLYTIGRQAPHKSGVVGCLCVLVCDTNSIQWQQQQGWSMMFIVNFLDHAKLQFHIRFWHLNYKKFYIQVFFYFHYVILESPSVSYDIDNMTKIIFMHD